QQSLKVDHEWTQSDVIPSNFTFEPVLQLNNNQFNQYTIEHAEFAANDFGFPPNSNLSVNIPFDATTDMLSSSSSSPSLNENSTKPTTTTVHANSIAVDMSNTFNVGNNNTNLKSQFISDFKNKFGQQGYDVPALNIGHDLKLEPALS